MSTLKKFIAQLYAPHKFVAAGAILFAVSQVPVMPKMVEPLTATATVMPAETNSVVATSSLADIFFGSKAESSDAVDTIASEMQFVSSRDAYPASLAVVEQYADQIKSTAAEHGVPADVAIGVALLENGGSITAKSPAGALGIYQLMPATARGLGLTVNSKTDDRKDPAKSIEAGISYLASNYQDLGDWGLATWAYHAGVGNVAKALKLYAKAHDGINLAGVKDFAGLKSYVVSHGITVDKLLSDPSVQGFTKKLNDDSAGYPYKVIATANLFRQANA
jgi:membrane-bound lytic murein transglycosylase D